MAKVEYCETFGELTIGGPTKRSVDRQVREELERLMTGEWAPYVRRYKGWTLLVYRDKYGWHSVVGDVGPNESFDQNGSGGTGYLPSASRDSVIAEGLFHLVQTAWMRGDVIPNFLPTRQRGEMASWVEWQVRYQDAREGGLSDVDAHDYAGRNPGRSHVWAEKDYTMARKVA